MKKPTNEQFKKQLEHMIQSLKNEMVQEHYGYGEYLPSEKALAARFQLSNNSVRKGLEQLVDEGWIEKIPRVGNRVIIRQSPVQLTLICNPTVFRNLRLEAVLQEFSRLYAWIKVETRTTEGNPAYEECSSDVLLMNDFQFLELVEQGHKGVLQPIRQSAVTYPFLNEGFKADGDLLAKPLVFGPVVLCYNKQHFRERGLFEPNGNWKWEDLVHHAQLLTENSNRYGFCFHLPALNRWPLFLLQSGEAFRWDGEGQLQDIRGSRLMDSIRLCKQILHNRKFYPLYLSEGNDDINQMFLDGKLSMVLTSYLGLNEWMRDDLEYDLSPVPFIHEPRTLSIVIAAGIHASSKHKEEAQLLVDFLASRQVQSSIRQKTLSIPAQQDVDESAGEEVPNFPSRYGLYKEILFSFRNHRDLNLETHEFFKLYKELKAYWADMISEDELWERIKVSLSRRRDGMHGGQHSSVNVDLKL